MKHSLPTDSDERKTYPLYRGLFGYFGAALAAVARHSYISNAKHNKDGPLHWSRENSPDHEDCILRHTLDLGELLAEQERKYKGKIGRVSEILYEADARAWRALAASQVLHERFDNAPFPFNAREPVVKCDPSECDEDCPGGRGTAELLDPLGED